MLVEFKNFNEVVINLYEKIWQLNFSDAFFSCNCNHFDSAHYLGIGRCYQGDCDCVEFYGKEIELKIEISLADIFSFENQELIFDSPEWWIEFKEFINADNDYMETISI